MKEINYIPKNVKFLGTDFFGQEIYVGKKRIYIFFPTAVYSLSRDEFFNEKFE